MRKILNESRPANESPPGEGHSRRLFLKGAGLLAGGVAGLAGLTAGCGTSTSARPPSPPLPDGGPVPLGFEARALELAVNGQKKTVSVEPRTTLLDVLREQAGFTGPKEVCDRGACGGCTVLLDGQAVCGCMTLALDAEGREVKTAEGVAEDPACAHIIDGMCEHDAAQCGFCIPGIVARASEILADNPKASSEQIKAGLSGNLCRCGTYSKIFDGLAVATGAQVARLASNDVAMQNELPRVDIRQKVSGSAKYAADQYPDKLVHAKFFRFPYGAGELTDYNLKAAKAVPGVLKVELTASKAEYPGARLGYVAAESEDAAEDAIEALAMKFERDPAPRSDAEKFYKGPAKPEGETKEALDQIFASSAAVVEATYRTQVQTHSSLETHGFMADHQGDKAVLWASTQGVYSVLGEAAEAFGLDKSKVEVRSEYVGGGFGSKFGAGPEGTLAAKLSKEFKRPCRVYPDRREEHLDTGNRPGSIQYMKIGADAKGKLLGGQVDLTGVVGYQEGQGAVRNPFNYDFGTIATESRDLTLNAGLPRAFRAPGHPQGVFAVESMIDELAAKLGMDPLEMRALNETSDRRRAQAKTGAKLIGWETRQPDGSSPGRIKRGLGMAAGHWHFWPTQCRAEAVIQRDGKVKVSSGVQDIGTGTFTVVADAAAEALGIGREWIVPQVGNSKYPEGPGSGGSQVTRSVVPAVQDALAAAKEEFVEAIASEWGAKPEDVKIEGGFVGAGEKKLAWKDACALMRSDTISAQGRAKMGNVGEGDTSATQFAEVEVDTETGQVRVKKIVAVQASGKFVNRLTSENQVCGGVIQGLSYALFEDRLLDPATGAMLNPNLEWYKIAGSMEIPEIVAVLDQNESDTGPRSIGEPATIPPAGAIANAVANAIGARVRSLPITPDRVLAALEEKKKGGSA